MYSSSKLLNTCTLVLATAISLVVPVQAQKTVTGGQPASVTILDSTRNQDGLMGSVRRVKIQSAKLEFQSGQLVKGPAQLLEVTTYSLGGNRIDNVTYPVASAAVGKEEYKYNDRGQIIEMTLRGNDGFIRSRERYEYEFDTFGNWRKMVTSLVLFENGKIKHEPVEVTYRELAYYFDDSVAKIVNPISPPIVLPTPSSRFPGIANAVSPDMRLDRVTRPDRPLLFEVGGEPPELPAPAKNEREALKRSNAGSNNPPSSKAEPTTVSLTPANGISAAVTRRTVPAPKETGNKSDSAARKGALAYYEKGREYFDLGALKDAVTSYQRSLELEPRSAEVYLSLGHAYLKLQNNQEAGKAFQHATLINPDLAEAHYGLGLHNFMMRRNKNAAEAFKRATLLRPDMAKAHYGLAFAYQELGRRDALIAEFRILENLDPGLAKKLSETFPESIQPCRVPRFCK